MTFSNLFRGASSRSPRKCSSKRRGASAKAGRRPALEPLEDRRLMTVTLAQTGSILNITGDVRNDIVDLYELRTTNSPHADLLQVVWRDNGGHGGVGQYAASALTKIVFHGGAGDDALRNVFNPSGAPVFTNPAYTPGVPVLVSMLPVIEAYGGTGNDILFGGPKNDLLYGGDGTDTLVGNYGNDRLDGGQGNDALHGGPDDDTYVFNNTSYGGGSIGVDTVTELANAGTDKLYFAGYMNRAVRVDLASTATQSVNSFLRLRLSSGATIENVHGTFYDDVIRGNSLDNYLYGSDGDDTLYGMAGNDTLDGSYHDDRLYGGEGVDTLYGGNGTDTLHGDNGNDRLYGQNHNDRLYGDGGNDTLDGGSGNDGLFGGGGHDTLRGGTGADRMLVWDALFSDISVDTVLDRESSDAVIHFRDTSGNSNSANGMNWAADVWSEDEIELVDNSLDWYHTLTNNTSLLKTNTGADLVFERWGSNLEPAGAGFYAWNLGGGRMSITDFGFANGESELNLSVIHEIAHNWDSESPYWSQWLGLSGWRPASDGSWSATATAQFFGNGNTEPVRGLGMDLRGLLQARPRAAVFDRRHVAWLRNSL